MDEALRDPDPQSTRLHIVRCALEDILARLDELPSTPDRDLLAVEALACAEAASRIEQSLGSPVEVRELLVRRIIDLEINLLELGRTPSVGSRGETAPPVAAPPPKARTPRAKVGRNARNAHVDAPPHAD